MASGVTDDSQPASPTSARARNGLGGSSTRRWGVALGFLLALVLPSAARASDIEFGRIAGDGSHAFFVTDESLVASDTDGLADVYERYNGVTSLVSTGPSGGNGT